MLPLVITCAVLLVLFSIGWYAVKQKQATGRAGPPDLPVPVLAASPRILDVPVYLDGVGAIRALNTVTVRSQVDGKLIAVHFTEGQDVQKGDVVGEIDPAIYQAQFDQAVAKKAQDVAQLANQRLDLTRYEQLAASNAGSKQQADTQRAAVAQTEALIRADQAAIDNAAATLSYTKIVAPLSGRAGLRQVDEGNIIHAADATGLVVITQLQPIAVWFSLPQQQIVRVNRAAARGELVVDVFGNDGVTVIDSGKLTGIDNQVDSTTGTLRLKAEFPNARRQLWPGQFVNVRLRVETLTNAVVVPTSAVQRGPLGTFSYVITTGEEGDIVTARPVTVAQQNEHDAVVSSGLAASDRVVTTGFALLADGSKVTIGRAEQTPTADLAPRKRSRGQGKGPEGKGQGKGEGKGGRRGHQDSASSADKDRQGATTEPQQTQDQNKDQSKDQDKDQAGEAQAKEPQSGEQTRDGAREPAKELNRDPAQDGGRPNRHRGEGAEPGQGKASGARQP